MIQLTKKMCRSVMIYLKMYELTEDNLARPKFDEVLSNVVVGKEVGWLDWMMMLIQTHLFVYNLIIEWLKLKENGELRLYIIFYFKMGSHLSTSICVFVFL